MAKDLKPFTGPVYGTIADGATPTVPVGGSAPETANLTGSKPTEPTDHEVEFLNPLGGGRMTVSSDNAHHFDAAGFKRVTK